MKQVKITIKGPLGVGKTRIAEGLERLLANDGWRGKVYDQPDRQSRDFGYYRSERFAVIRTILVVPHKESRKNLGAIKGMLHDFKENPACADLLEEIQSLLDAADALDAKFKLKGIQ